MAARKTTKKAKRSTSAASKKTASKKTASKKSASKKTSSHAKKDARPKDASGDASPAAAPAAAGKSGGVSSRDVNMGNVFALRPRVTTSFRQENFLEARRLLEDESFDTLDDAARAVAERALELCNDPGGRHKRTRGR